MRDKVRNQRAKVRADGLFKAIWYLLLTAAQLGPLRWHSSCGITQLLLMLIKTISLKAGWCGLGKVHRQRVQRAPQSSGWCSSYFDLIYMALIISGSWFGFRTKVSLLVAFH